MKESKRLQALETRILELALRVGWNIIINDTHTIGTEVDPNMVNEDLLRLTVRAYADATRADEKRRKVFGTAQSRLKVPRDIDRELSIGGYSSYVGVQVKRRALGLQATSPKYLRRFAQSERAEARAKAQP